MQTGWPATLFLLQLAATLFMTGLIWFVQIVHYPLFAEVGRANLARYETLHAQRTTWVVFPPMVVELLAACAWLYPPLRPVFIDQSSAIMLAVLVGVIWITTGVGHVPLHTRLGQVLPEHPRATLRQLVRLNWIRTVAWTLRAALLLAALRHAL